MTRLSLTKQPRRHSPHRPASAASEIATITRLEAEKAELLAGLRIFLGHDERFHVAVGGNPIAVDRMLGAARSLLSKLEENPE